MYATCDLRRFARGDYSSGGLRKVFFECVRLHLSIQTERDKEREGGREEERIDKEGWDKGGG